MKEAVSSETSITSVVVSFCVNHCSILYGDHTFCGNHSTLSDSDHRFCVNHCSILDVDHTFRGNHSTLTVTTGCVNHCSILYGDTFCGNHSTLYDSDHRFCVNHFSKLVLPEFWTWWTKNKKTWSFWNSVSVVRRKTGETRRANRRGGSPATGHSTNISVKSLRNRVLFMANTSTTFYVVCGEGGRVSRHLSLPILFRSLFTTLVWTVHI